MSRRILICLLATALLLMGVAPAMASSHREAPLISNDPVADNTDSYAFVSPDNTHTVTFVGNWLPFEEPAGGPNFYRFGDDVLYEFHVFNNTDRRADITYQFRFKTTVRNGNTFLYNTGPISSLSDPNWNVRQFYSITRIQWGKATVIAKDLPTPPSNVGPKSTPHYAALAASAVKSLPCGVKVFAGQRDDPFFADVGAIFDLLTIRNDFGAHGGGIDALGGFNCQTIALRVPITQLTSNGRVPFSATDPHATIGFYASASRQRVSVLRTECNNAGPQVQVSRLAEPLINEVVIPLKAKDAWNASDPVNDQQFLPYYRDPEVARLLHGLYGISVPPTPRNDLVAILLNGINLQPLGIPFSNVGGPPNSDLIRLNVAVAPKKPGDAGYSRLGILGGDLSGFPNGRRLSDDVVDIELQAIAGATPFTPTFDVSPNNQLGDGVDKNDLPFMSGFPYVATPWQGFQDTHGTPSPVH